MEQQITLGDWLDIRDEMKAAEVLLEDVEIEPHYLERYWALSANLLALIEETDALMERRREHGPDADEPAQFLNARRRLVHILAGAEEIGIYDE